MNGTMKNASKGLRILLIMPRSELYQKKKGFRKNLRYAPLTLTTLAALTPERFHPEFRIIDEGVEFVEYDNLTADLVGITCITGTSHRAYMIADSFRARGVPVVLGGPHPTLLPEEAKLHADAVVTGLANDTWPELLDDFTDGGLKPFYREPRKNLVNMPLPRRELLQKRGYIISSTVKATYGCPYECEFCVVRAIRGGYYHRPVEDVAAEVKALGTKHVMFLDSSPTEDRVYALSLYRALIPLRIRWFGLSTVNIGNDPELLDAMVESGCIGLLIGFESVSQDSLKKMRKGFSKVASYEDFIGTLHEKGIAVNACFAFGSDEDPPSIFDETVDFVIRTGLDLPRYAVLTPFPNTPFYRRLKEEGRLLTEDWTKYNAQNVVFRPKLMSPEELLDGITRAWKRTYSPANTVKRLAISRTRLPYSIVANLGYMFYANDLSRYR